MTRPQSEDCGLEVERLRRALIQVQDEPCGIPGHAVAVGCNRGLLAQAALGGWDPEGEDGPLEFARTWVTEEDARQRRHLYPGTGAP